MLAEALCNALGVDGLVLSAHQEAQLQTFVAAIREAQPRVSLVSAGDLAVMEDRHLPDCLALAALVKQLSPGTHLDIGSGGGFPGVVLAVALPERPIVLLERSEKKSSFLGEVIARIGLGNAEVVLGEFPVAARALEEGLVAPVVSVSARAVEKPDKMLRRILRWLPDGATYFCQFPDRVASLPEGIVQENVPAGSSANYRRGTLRIYKRA